MVWWQTTCHSCKRVPINLFCECLRWHYQRLLIKPICPSIIEHSRIPSFYFRAQLEGACGISWYFYIFFTNCTRVLKYRFQTFGVEVYLYMLCPKVFWAQFTGFICVAILKIPLLHIKYYLYRFQDWILILFY